MATYVTRNNAGSLQPISVFIASQCGIAKSLLAAYARPELNLIYNYARRARSYPVHFYIVVLSNGSIAWAMPRKMAGTYEAAATPIDGCTVHKIRRKRRVLPSMTYLQIRHHGNRPAMKKRLQSIKLLP